MNLTINNCHIFLKKSEKKYLKENLNSNSNLSEVFNTLLNLYHLSDVRYYKIEQIKEIAISLYEELGRDKKNHSGKDNITPAEILHSKDVYTEKGIDPVSGFDIVTIKLKNPNRTIIKQFSNTNDADDYIRKLLYTNINL